MSMAALADQLILSVLLMRQPQGTQGTVARQRLEFVRLASNLHGGNTEFVSNSFGQNCVTIAIAFLRFSLSNKLEVSHLKYQEPKG